MRCIMLSYGDKKVLLGLNNNEEIILLKQNKLKLFMKTIKEDIDNIIKQRNVLSGNENLVNSVQSKEHSDKVNDEIMNIQRKSPIQSIDNTRKNEKNQPVQNSTDDGPVSLDDTLPAPVESIEEMPEINEIDKNNETVFSLLNMYSSDDDLYSEWNEFSNSD
ncbi:hypothetical protein TRFO_08169 [Tritrichomonas foetus]|uniref:Uncharacterized protein n=1 Tax=Tritrichomonas foetus TaxID=1144522 RepID=A0A1J4JL85_9EUKA|nr:hypothetical protein TRFO_08169 [Tritrichomonas foetus]|eukprot:OHS99872.1 hypothetical protein TRFO_08169 [Tritrichomonas foetus]